MGCRPLTLEGTVAVKGVLAVPRRSGHDEVKAGAHWVCVARCEDCERMTTDRRWRSVDNRAGGAVGRDGIVVGRRRMQALPGDSGVWGQL